MRKIISKINLKNLICIIGLFIFAFAFITKFIDNDFFFDVKTGESILKYGIDFKDHFSFISGLTYLYHHWFYDIIIYFVYSKLGYVGILLFFSLIFFAFSIIYFLHLNKLTKNKAISMFITAYVMYISSYAFTVRVQSVTYVLFLLELIFLEKLYERGQLKHLIFLFIDLVLIANLHMTLWIFSIVLLLPFVAEYIVYLIDKKSKKFHSTLEKYIKIEKPYSEKLFIISILILILSGLFSPLVPNTYTFFLKVIGNDAYSFVVELQHTSLYVFPYLIALLVVFIIGLYLKVFSFKLRDFLLVVGLFLFSLLANRNVIYFLYITPIVLIKNCNFKLNLKNINFINKLKTAFKKANKKVVEWFVFISLIFILIFLVFKTNLKTFNYNIEKDYPVKSVNYIVENLDYKNIKLYTDYNYGSYAEFFDIKIFVDSRAEVFLPEFNGGTDVISDYHKANTFDKYKKIFNKYKFDYALVYKDSDLNLYLNKDSDFEKIFEEKKYVLYKRNF